MAPLEGRGDVSTSAQVEGSVVIVPVTWGSRGPVRKADGRDMPEPSLLPEIGCKRLRCRDVQQRRERAGLCQAGAYRK